ncbi:thiamine phosphate synthase [Pelagibius sp. Alg239-R121]|uniref:thiamine phosphate synthase n=1 Tax=Pelagibius sp. Alg239-R121 TaxID=2993448 RepID=UPI0024A7842A|nr:thiamine phosphate synthase [Pelagibius sp. Alg239-R121]
MTCRLYLTAPTDLGSPERPIDAFANLLADVLNSGAFDCLLLPRGNADETTTRRSIERLCPIAQDLGVAVVLEGDAGLAKETGCDGVHLSNPKAYGGARKLLGDDAIVGVDCGLSRHLAMEAAERGADYVAFKRPSIEGAENLEVTDETAPTLEAVLEWWQAMIETPCIAMDAKDEKDCANLAKAGADFVALGDDFWQGGAASDILKNAADSLS